MRAGFNLFNLFLALGCCVLAGCSGGSDRPDSPKSSPIAVSRAATVFRSHFLGTTRLSEQTNAEPWISIGRLPTTEVLARQSLGKLSRAPYQLTQHRIGTTNNF